METSSTMLLRQKFCGELEDEEEAKTTVAELEIVEAVEVVENSEAEEKADEAVEMMEEAEDMVATSATCLFSRSELAGHAP